MAFLSSTNRLKELKLLQEIEKNCNLTQKELGAIIGAAPSMVNLYLNDFEAAGFIEKEQKNARSFSYRITRSGIVRKDYLLVDYIHELLGLYETARKNIEVYIKGFSGAQNLQVVLYGSGVVAHTLLWVLRDMNDSPVRVVGIVDDDERKLGESIMGFTVATPESLNEIKHDAVLITAYLDEEKILDKLVGRGYAKPVFRFFNLKEL